MNPIVLAGPAVEPISRADAKAYLRLDTDDEDELVDALIMAARITVERATRLCLLTQQLRFTTTQITLDQPVTIPLAPIISADAVRVQGADGIFALLAAEGWHLVDEADPAQLVIGPTAGLAVGRAKLQVDLTCGYGPSAADIPEPLILAIRRLVAFWFEDRGDGPPRAGSPWLPADVAALIAPFRRARLA